MDFSDTIPYTNVSEYSPDGRWIATIQDAKLIIRDGDSLDVARTQKLSGTAQKIKWSPDSKYIMTAHYKRGVVQVHSLEDKKWTCKITEGVAGISGAQWAPDSRHILTVQEFQLRVSIWSLSENKRRIIQSPKYSEKGIKFSPNGKYLAVVERKGYKDHIGIYLVETWEMIKQFQVSTTDLEDIQWAPDDSVIAVWDTNLEYTVFIYSPTGKQLGKYQAYEGYLGIKKVAWSTTGLFLSIGSFDQKLRLINNITWSKICEFEHATPMTSSHVVVYNEMNEDWEDDGTKIEENLRGKKSSKKRYMRQKNKPAELKGPTKYVIQPPPANIPQIIPDPSSANLPKMGVGIIDWSCNDEFVITRNDNMPHTLWVWNVKFLSLISVIKHDSPIRCAVWDPTRSRLLLCTGKNKLYMWSQEGCSIINVPLKDFKVRSLKWNPHGGSLILMDKNKFCCCYINDPDENVDPNSSAANQKNATENSINQSNYTDESMISHDSRQ